MEIERLSLATINSEIFALTSVKTNLLCEINRSNLYAEIKKKESDFREKYMKMSEGEKLIVVNKKCVECLHFSKETEEKSPFFKCCICIWQRHAAGINKSLSYSLFLEEELERIEEIRESIPVTESRIHQINLRVKALLDRKRHLIDTKTNFNCLQYVAECERFYLQTVKEHADKVKRKKYMTGLSYE